MLLTASLRQAMAAKGVTEDDVWAAQTKFDAAVAKADLHAARTITETPAFRHLLLARANATVAEWKEAGFDVPSLLLSAMEHETKATDAVILQAQVESISSRLAAVERRCENGPFKFMGVFSEGVDYQKGCVVTHDGSLWHANTATRSRPGGPGTGYEWTLCCKRGRDGRDQR